MVYLVKLETVLWSLELASEVFLDFFVHDFGGEEPDSAGQNSRKNTVARDARLGKNLRPRKGNCISRD